MTFPRMRVTIVEWTNKNNGRAYSKYLGCEKVKLANVAWKHSCKNFRANGFRLSFVIDQQHFKYEANTSAFLKDLKFSIKLSAVRANCSTLECQGKKKQQAQTNKQKEQNEPFCFTKVHNDKFFNNKGSNSLKIQFICLVK